MDTEDRFETDSLKKGDEIQAIVVANDGMADRLWRQQPG